VSVEPPRPQPGGAVMIEGMVPRRPPRRSLTTCLGLVASLSAAVPLSGQLHDVELSADSIEIGDRVDLRFALDIPDGGIAFFPDSLQAPGVEPFGPVEWESVAGEPTTGSEGATRLSVVYPLLVFRTGSVFIPELDVFLASAEESRTAGFSAADDVVGSWEAFREAPGAAPSARLLTVPEQRLQVVTVLGLDDITTQITPRPAADVAGGDRDWRATALVLGFGLLLLGVGTASLRDLDRMRAQGPPKPPPSPRERALAAMDDLLESGLHRDGRIRDFYAGWSGVVRRYVEGLAEPWGPSWTSTELMADLQGPRRSVAMERSLGPEGIAREMRLAERVKFGGARPDPESAEDDWKTVRDWLAASGEGR